MKNKWHTHFRIRKIYSFVNNIIRYTKNPNASTKISIISKYSYVTDYNIQKLIVFIYVLASTKMEN